MSAFELLVEEIGESHIEPYAALSRTEYGDAPVAQPEHLRWKFLRNPQGPAWGVHLLLDGTLVGRLAAMPRRFSGGGGAATAAYIVDLLVHPQHRGMPALLQLMRGFGRLRERFDLVIVTPNAAGLPVWERFAKLPSRFDLGVWAAPIRPARILGRIALRALTVAAPVLDAEWSAVLRAAGALARPGRGITLDARWPDDDELDALTAERDGTAAGVRDRAFLAWRFRDGPLFRYDVAFVRVRGRLAGYVATRRTTYAGFDTRFIVDAFGPGLERADWRRAALLLAAAEAKEGGAELLLLLGNTQCGALRALAGLPFVRVPARQLPQRTTLFAEWWSAAAFDLAAERFAFTLADCDMI